MAVVVSFGECGQRRHGKSREGSRGQNWKVRTEMVGPGSRGETWSDVIWRDVARQARPVPV